MERVDVPQLLLKIFLIWVESPFPILVCRYQERLEETSQPSSTVALSGEPSEEKVRQNVITTVQE